MNHISDLNIETEVLPLFDFTLNFEAKVKVREIIKSPLASVAEIRDRQDILKGFVQNYKLLRSYSYVPADFLETYIFLNDNSIRSIADASPLRLALSKVRNDRVRVRCIQMVVLFKRICETYLNKLAKDYFPKSYHTELIKLQEFFNSLNLDYHSKAIGEDRYNWKHINALAKAISEKQENGDMAAFFQTLFTFEAYLSIAIGICRQKFCFPTFLDTSFAIQALFHPWIQEPIKNDFTSNRNIVIVTGPNMSGKSTLLKSIGLCVYLAHVGVGVPASKAELPFFNGFSFSFNHSDDLGKGYSHFMNELIQLKQVLVQANAGRRWFAIFDELFKGTTAEDAVHISAQTIEGLAKIKNCYVLISTHLHQLKETHAVKAKEVETFYIDCEMVDGRPDFTYKLKTGWSDLKIGQILFNREGLSDLLDAKA